MNRFGVSPHNIYQRQYVQPKQIPIEKKIQSNKKIDNKANEKSENDLERLLKSEPELEDIIEFFADDADIFNEDDQNEYIGNYKNKM